MATLIVLPYFDLTEVVFVVGWHAKWLLGDLIVDTLAALLVLTLAGFVLLRYIWSWGRISAICIAGASALALVLGVPTIHEALHRKREPAAQHPIVSAVDLLIVSPARNPFVSGASIDASGIPPPPEDLYRWRASYSLATVSLMRNPFSTATRQPRLRVRDTYLDRRQALEQLGKSPLTTLGAVPPARPLLNSSASLFPRPQPWAARREARGAVVLNVDGLAPFSLGISTIHRAQPIAWPLEVLDEISGLGVPVYAILATGDGRLGQWTRWAERTGGDAVRLSATGRYVLTDAALRVATEKRATFRDFGLAWRYRPHLWFDEEERYKRPLDVGALLGSGAVQLCRTEFDAEDTDCRPLTGEHPIDTDYGFLKMPKGADLVSLDKSLGSAIYYHVDRPAEPPDLRPPEAAERPAGDDRVYIDYWWYFPYNPTPLRGGFCGPGFATDGWTCFDHESDWEGLTVTLSPLGGHLVPAAVTYAQHDVGVTYDWSKAVQKWETSGKYVADHPLVYVATSSHASYAVPCPNRPCAQVQHGMVRKDGPHGGDDDWSLNDDEACARDGCLKEIPIDVNGNAALWNAFHGPWGRRHCLWKFPICDIGSAPSSPSSQRRYERPWQAMIRAKRTKLNGTWVRVGKYSTDSSWLERLGRFIRNQF